MCSTRGEDINILVIKSQGKIRDEVFASAQIHTVMFWFMTLHFSSDENQRFSFAVYFTTL
jgi:hypothetical protein